MKSSDLLNDVIRKMSRSETEDMSESDSRNFRLMVGKDCDIDSEDLRIINEFLDQCAKTLDLNDEKSKIKTTAICSFSSKNIRIYCKSRSLADVLRSIAHEAFHLRQHEVEAVPRNMPPHHLNPIEFDANVFGGSMLSLFALKKGRDKIYR